MRVFKKLQGAGESILIEIVLNHDKPALSVIKGVIFN